MQSQAFRQSKQLEEKNVCHWDSIDSLENSYTAQMENEQFSNLT